MRFDGLTLAQASLTAGSGLALTLLSNVAPVGATLAWIAMSTTAALALGQWGRRRVSDRHRASLAQVEEQMRVIFAENVSRGLVLDHLRGGLNRLAAGDVTHRLKSQFSRFYEPLRNDFNAAAARLAEAQAAALRINRRAAHLRDTCQDHACRSDWQPELAHLMGSSGKISGNLALAEALALQATTDLELLAGGLDRSVRAMSVIEAGSKEALTTLKELDALALRTSLLALQVGDEAGETGALPALKEEARQLAEQSATTAMVVRERFGAGFKLVAEGVQSLASVAGVMPLLAARLQEAKEVVGEASVTADIHSFGLQNIATVWGQIEFATDQNAATLAEAASTARSLVAETERLTPRTDSAADRPGARPPAPTRHRTTPPVRPARAAVGSFPLAACQPAQWVG
ncbi:hypothetical protein [Sphingomonas glaciei]|uniref:Methyl-accepting chemotaxis protein n=1 Tax=Sphingomonas glaciei TaxID=2938948 RepID=A0ABY5MWJ5_9SPHN|nr:hypothetical protein [Sphingomonas glaciei]UUR08361.1 hypothetical protein M1K48_01565 [Sphingomonas glaciei]